MFDLLHNESTFSKSFNDDTSIFTDNVSISVHTVVAREAKYSIRKKYSMSPSKYFILKYIVLLRHCCS